MKTNHTKYLFAAVFTFVACSTVVGDEKEKTSQTSAPFPTKTSAVVVSVRWIDIKDSTYEMRALFFTGLTQLEAKVDGQISELAAKRAAMTSDVNTKDWDFAMKEMGDARSFLKSVGAEMSRVNADTWTQQKDAVGRAWLRTQTAYDKVKSSTTR